MGGDDAVGLVSGIDVGDILLVTAGETGDSVGGAVTGALLGRVVGALVVGALEGAAVVGLAVGVLVWIAPTRSAWENVVGLAVGVPTQVPHSISQAQGHASIKVSISFAEKPM